MKRECEEHEAAMVERISKIIYDKVEIAVQKKMIPLTRWIMGSIIGIVSIFIMIVISNAYSMGKIELYIEQQKDLNLTMSQKLNKAQTNQIYIIFCLKKLDPDFEVPYTRGGEIKEKL